MISLIYVPDETNLVNGEIVLNWERHIFINGFKDLRYWDHRVQEIPEDNFIELGSRLSDDRKALILEPIDIEDVTHKKLKVTVFLLPR